MVRKLFSRMGAAAHAGLLALGVTVTGVGGAVVSMDTAHAQTAFSPAAMVNEDVITYYDVIQRARILAIGGATPGPALNSASLEQLIDDQLRLQVAERFNTIASEQEINSGLDELGARQEQSGAELVASLAQQGVDEDAIRDVIISQIVWNKVVAGRFTARATPSEVELDQELELAATTTEKRYRIAEIAVPADESNFSRAEAFLNGLRDTVVGGARFSDVARQNSRSPTAQRGGEIGWVPEASLPPAMLAELNAMSRGDVTRPIGISGGAAIFQLLDIEETAPRWTQDSTYSLQRISVPLGDTAADRAVAIAEGDATCGSLPDLDEDISTARLNDVAADSLPQDVRSAVAGLEAGGKTRPLSSENTLDVYVVCSARTGAPAAIREQVREQIRGQRLARLAEGFLQELRRDAVIERR